MSQGQDWPYAPRQFDPHRYTYLWGAWRDNVGIGSPPVERMRQAGSGNMHLAVPLATSPDSVDGVRLDAALSSRFVSDGGDGSLQALADIGNQDAQFWLDRPPSADLWTEGDYRAAIERFESLAPGNMVAQRLLADALSTGWFVPTDMVRAKMLYEGVALGAPDGIAPDDYLAALRFAAEANRVGIGGDPDLQMARTLLTIGSELGDPVADLGLALLSLREQDQTGAESALTRALQPCREGIYERCDTRAVILGLYFEPEPAELIGWMSEKAAIDPLAAIVAADYYIAQEDFEVAQDLLGINLEGRPLSQARLGDLELAQDGREGVDSAVAYLNRAASAGVPDALMTLAELQLDQEWDESALRATYQDALIAASLNAQLSARARNVFFRVCQADLPCEPVPVVFVTDRNQSAEDDEQIWFGNRPDPEGRLWFGLGVVDIPVSRREIEPYQDLLGRIGVNGSDNRALYDLDADSRDERRSSTVENLIDDADWGQYRTIVDGIGPFEAVTPSQWQALAVAEGLQTQRALVFVHGYNTSFENALRLAAITAERMQFPALPVVFSWSSADDEIAFGEDLVNAEAACGRFRKVIGALGDALGPDNIDILMHSVGSILGLAAFGHCRAAEAAEATAPQVDKLIFAAPAAIRYRFEAAISDVRLRANNATVYVSEHDKALMIGQIYYRLMSWNWFLRIAGLGGTDRMIINPDTAQVETIDASDVEANAARTTLSLGHSYVFERQQVVDDVEALIKGATELDGPGRCADQRDEGAGSYAVIRQNC